MDPPSPPPSKGPYQLPYRPGQSAQDPNVSLSNLANNLSRPAASDLGGGAGRLSDVRDDLRHEIRNDISNSRPYESTPTLALGRDRDDRSRDDRRDDRSRGDSYRDDRSRGDSYRDDRSRDDRRDDRSRGDTFRDDRSRGGDSTRSGKQKVYKTTEVVTETTTTKSKKDRDRSDRYESDTQTTRYPGQQPPYGAPEPYGPAMGPNMAPPPGYGPSMTNLPPQPTMSTAGSMAAGGLAGGALGAAAAYGASAMHNNNASTTYTTTARPPKGGGGGYYETTTVTENAYTRTDMRSARSATAASMGTLISLQREYRDRLRYGTAGTVQEQLRIQTGVVLGDLRALRRAVASVAKRAENRRFRRWLVGTLLATFIPLVRRLFRRYRRKEKEEAYGADAEHAYGESAYKDESYQNASSTRRQDTESQNLLTTGMSNPGMGSNRLFNSNAAAGVAAAGGLTGVAGGMVADRFDNRYADNRYADNRYTENRFTDTKVTDVKFTDTKSKFADDRYVDTSRFADTTSLLQQVAPGRRYPDLGPMVDTRVYSRHLVDGGRYVDTDFADAMVDTSTYSRQLVDTSRRYADASSRRVDTTRYGDAGRVVDTGGYAGGGLVDAGRRYESYAATDNRYANGVAGGIAAGGVAGGAALADNFRRTTTFQSNASQNPMANPMANPMGNNFQGGNFQGGNFQSSNFQGGSLSQLNKPQNPVANLSQRIDNKLSSASQILANDTEYAFAKSRALLDRIRQSMQTRGGLAAMAMFVFAVLYVFSNEVTLRVARTVSKRLKRLSGKIEMGDELLDDHDVRLLTGWRWRILLWGKK